MLNKVMVSIHIADYLVLIIANIAAVTIPTNDVMAFEIVWISDLVVVSVCNVIFGLILY